MAEVTERSASKKTPRKTKSAENEIQWIEVPVFIHGISPEKYPSSGVEEYKQLLDRINTNLEKYLNKKFTADPIFVTWGIPTKPRSVGTDQYLAEVERDIQIKVKEEMGKAYDGFLGFPGAIRDMLFFGISDLFYYVSGDGEADLRTHIFTQISKAIQAMGKGNKSHISLTIFGHSAGSIIAHDMLYHMFSFKDHISEEGPMENEMNALRKIIRSGRLRIRRLYTFGSPISLLTLRASSLVNKFRKGGTFLPQDIGLQSSADLSMPRWVNFWSRYDIASYPVSFLYSNQEGQIEDHEIKTSINPKTAHTGYWTSNEMAKYISKTF
ncbi:MAG: hypothetical protein U0Z26_13030 [Anaerolineales bacterium]